LYPTKKIIGRKNKKKNGQKTRKNDCKVNDVRERRQTPIIKQNCGGKLLFFLCLLKIRYVKMIKKLSYSQSSESPENKNTVLSDSSASTFAKTKKIISPA